jgi:hypothetical protein
MSNSPPTRFHNDAEFNQALLLALKPMHEAWCGLPLVALV